MNIGLLLVFIIVPYILHLSLKPSKNIDGDKLIFEYNKSFKTVVLIGLIFFSFLSIGLFFAMKNNQNNGMVIFSIFLFVLISIFSIICLLFYLHVRNKKIIYENDIFIAHNIFNKERKYNINDISEAIEKLPDDGMLLIFKDGSKLKIDMPMSNYSKVKDILNEKNIICKDKNGNINPKGW